MLMEKLMKELPVQLIKNAYDQIMETGQCDCTLYDVHMFTTPAGLLFIDADGTYHGEPMTDRLESVMKEVVDKVLW